MEETLDTVDDEEIEEEADAEVDKVLFELTDGKLGQAGKVGAELPVNKTSTMSLFGVLTSRRTRRTRRTLRRCNGCRNRCRICSVDRLDSVSDTRMVSSMSIMRGVFSVNGIEKSPVWRTGQGYRGMCHYCLYIMYPTIRMITRVQKRCS